MYRSGREGGWGVNPVLFCFCFERDLTVILVLWRLLLLWWSAVRPPSMTASLERTPWGSLSIVVSFLLHGCEHDLTVRMCAQLSNSCDNISSANSFCLHSS